MASRHDHNNQFKFLEYGFRNIVEARNNPPSFGISETLLESADQLHRGFGARREFRPVESVS